ncbi:MAG TPA: HDOD domain-containing protein [Burkholderiales bacterium]|nr:HDOD domain-containing protein [Burkholderiales bacterium]
MATVSIQNPALRRYLDSFASRKIPVLARSVKALAALRAVEDAVNPRDVAQAVLRDPMLTLIVVRHLQTHRSRRKLEDITTVEHAIMMLGVQRFFSAFELLPAVEDALGARPDALAGLMQVVGRARTAAIYARAFAGARSDLSSDEVVVAALLHDITEILLWCFEPERASAIAARLKSEPGLRSADAQRHELGFTLLELQLELARRWGLPDLFLSLMDDAQAENPRVRNVALAVALSRHAWNGWTNAALPSDMDAIGLLLGVPRHVVSAHIFDATLSAIEERDWYGTALARSYLPNLPPPGPLPKEASRSELRHRSLEAARSWLDSIARGVPLHGHPRKGMLRDAKRETLAGLAALLDGISAGLGFSCGAFLVPAGPAGRLQLAFLSGDARGLGDLEGDSGAMGAVSTAVANKTPMLRVGGQAEGRPRGVFVFPVIVGTTLSAVALALGPHEAACLGPESFRQFKELGQRFDELLHGMETVPFWEAEGR